MMHRAVSSRRLTRFPRARACLLVGGASLLLTVQAASGTLAVTGATARQLAAPPSPQAACSKALSPGAVSAIVGHSVPAPTGTVVDVKPTALNHEVGAVGTSCEFTTGTSLAALKTAVVVTNEVTSTPLTPTAVEAGLKAVSSTVSATAYSGLGIQGIYYTQTLPGAITVYGMIGFNGKTEDGAAVYVPLAKSKLASLVRLAEKV
jgi:hypothetical protein